MDMEGQVAEAIVDELQRQAEASAGDLSLTADGGRLDIRGTIDLDALAMAVVGAVAGGP
jgi:hypothetical protein